MKIFSVWASETDNLILSPVFIILSDVGQALCISETQCCHLSQSLVDTTALL